MKKAKIRDRKSRFHGTRFKVGNQRYIIRTWRGNNQVKLDDLFPWVNYSKLKHNEFYFLINKLLPTRFRKEFHCSSFIQIHNCSANYSYDMVIEPNRIICFPKPIGYVINLKRRKARHYEET